MTKAEGVVRSAGASMGRFAAVVQGAVVKALKAATVATAGFVAASAVVGAKFQQQMAMVGAITGATREQFEALEAQARKLGATTEFTASQAAEGLEALARAGASVEESIEASNAALLLAGTSGAELGEATTLLVATMRQFGLQADDSGRIVDVMSKSMRTSLLDFSSLREAMKFAGTAGAAFGMSLEETVASVAAFRDLGLEGSLAGTQLRMALIQAAKGSDQAEEALSRYGLKLKDIDPATRSFADIIETLGLVGISAADSITVFGARAGANVAQLAAMSAAGAELRMMLKGVVADGGEADTILAQYGLTLKDINPDVKTLAEITEALQAVNIEAADAIKLFGTEAAAGFELLVDRAAESAVDIRGFTTELEDAAGSTADMYEFIGDTVVFQLKILKSVLQDFMITIFETFGRPLQDLIEELGLLVGSIADEFRRQSVSMTSDIRRSFDDVLSFLRKNQQEIARGFVDMAVAVGKFIAALGPLLVTLSAIIPLLDDIAILVGTIFVAVKVAQFASAVGIVAEAFLGLNATLVVFGTTLTATTGGTFALIAAIGVLVAGIAVYIRHISKAEDATDQLREAQDRLAASARETTQAEIDAIRPLLEAQKERARQILESGDRITPVLRRELETILEMTAAEIAAAKAAGELVETGEGFRTVVSLIEEGGAEMGALGGTIAETRRALAAAETDVVSLTKATTDSVRTSILESNKASGLRNDLLMREQADDLALLEQRIRDAEGLRAALERLETDTAKARGDRRRTELEEEEELQGGRVKAHTSAEDEMLKKRLEAAKAVEALMRSLSESLAGVTETDEQRRTAAFEKTLEEIDRVFDAQLALFEGNAARISEIERGREDASKLALKKFLAEEAKVELDAIQERNERIVSERGKVDATLEKLRSSRMSEIEKLETELADTLIEMTAATDAERLTIENDFARRIQEIRRREGEATRDMTRTLMDDLQELAAVAEKAAVAIAAPFKAVFGAVKTVTGFSVDLMALVEQAGQLRDEAEEAGKRLPIAAAAKQAVDELVDGAVVFAETLAAAIGPVIRAIADRIPDLVDAFVAALPKILRSVIDAIPILVQSIVDALPALLKAIVDGLVLLLRELPDLITILLGEIPVIIDALVAELPRLIEAIIAAVPAIIIAVAQAIPDIVAAVARAVPAIAIALVSAVVTELLPQLPKIALELIKAVVLSIFALASEFVKAFTEIFRRALPNFLRKKENRDPGREGIFKKVGNFVGSLFGKDQGAQSGIEFAPRRLMVEIERGEAVLNTQQNADRMSAGGGPAPAGAFPSGAAPGGGAGGFLIEVPVLVDGRLIESAMIRSEDLGKSFERAKRVRRSTGVRVGFDSGGYTPWRVA